MKHKRRALFLDRDGVINIDHGYVHLPEHFEFIHGIIELCQRATEKNYIIIVITNQAGIGRGYYTEEQFHELTQWMNKQLLEKSVKIERVYFCPYHPEHGIDGYKSESDFRKPAPGMILEAAKEYDIDLSLSLLVGDKNTDIQAGVSAGVGTNILFSPNAASKKTIVPEAKIVTRLQDVMPYLG